MTRPRGLYRDRRPTTLDEAQEMWRYNERIIATSASPQRIERAQRMLENLKPELARLATAAAAVPTPAPPRRSSDSEFEYEVVWNGQVGLCSDGLGSSLGGRQFDVSVRRG